MTVEEIVWKWNLLLPLPFLLHLSCLHLHPSKSNFSSQIRTIGNSNSISISLLRTSNQTQFPVKQHKMRSMKPHQARVVKAQQHTKWRITTLPWREWWETLMSITMILVSISLVSIFYLDSNEIVMLPMNIYMGLDEFM